MTVQLTAVETVSDALFTCSYLWAHGKQYSRSDLDKAIHQHKDPTTRYGKLVARLNQIAAMPYEELCDAGYLDTDRKQMIAARRSVLVEEIGEEEMNALLSDLQRIHRVFPEAGAKLRTKLPLTRGSEGFDVRQDYILKHFLPAQSLCSIYGPSGSYKSFLAVSWACHIAAGLSWAGKRSLPAQFCMLSVRGVGVPRRIRAWEQVHGIHADNLWLVNRPVFPVRESEVTEVLLAAAD